MIRRWNPYGTWSLFAKETNRFLKVKMQTIVAPVLTGMMYLIVFRYAMGERQVPGLNIDYFNFLVPGLVMMSMLQSAFANTSSSLISSKVMQVHIYLLMAPLSSIEVVAAYICAAVVRAMCVGAVLLLALWPFVHLSIQHIWMVLTFGVLGSILMAILGFLSGIWSRKFDDIALVSNFMILPLTFLSGVFYSVRQLPEFWQQVNHLNPFFYLIDGFRYGFLDVGDTQPVVAAWVVGSACIIGLIGIVLLWRSGWRMKS